MTRCSPHLLLLALASLLVACPSSNDDDTSLDDDDTFTSDDDDSTGDDDDSAGDDDDDSGGDDDDSGDDDDTPALLKSPRRGLAYNLTDPADFAALAPGVSWYYNWYFGTEAPDSLQAEHQLEFVPMLWGTNPEIDYASLESYLAARPDVENVLLLNEPNLTDQANRTPEQAAADWVRYEQLRDDMLANHGRTIRLIGPAVTWGTMPGYGDPVVWLDAFYAAFQATHGRDPQIDALAFHWYDYGLNEQLTRLEKYGKPFWVTEFANWHTEPGWTIDTEQKQIDALTDMVAICEARADVERYAWFIGRMSPDPFFSSLLGAQPGTLTGVGEAYLAQPWSE